MSSPSALLSAAQKPRVELIPEAVFSHVDDACFLASGYGLVPDPWQYHVLDGWLGEGSTGKWASGRCGLAVGRQNGKNAVIEIRELYGMVALGEKFLHTAHEVKTCRKAFKRLQYFFGECVNDPNARFPELNALVKELRSTNGQEAIILHNGGSVEFIARSKKSGLGFTVDVLVLDEAQELTDDHMEALKPTNSSGPQLNPQTIFTGTPPPPDSLAKVFRRIRAEGEAGTGVRLCWHEWSIPDVVDFTDRKFWFATNPSLGNRLLESEVEQELPPTMSPEGFMRQRLGLWPKDDAEGSRLITVDQWDETGLEDPPASGTKSFGVAFSFDGTRVGVAGGLKHADGVHVELIDAFSGHLEDGVSALAEWLAARRDEAAMIVISGSAGASVLRQALKDLGVPDRVIHVATTTEYFSACSMLYDAVKTGDVTHTASEGQTVLDLSVGVCDKKNRGTSGAWGWASTVPGGDETPIEAVSLAFWAARTTKRNPARKVRAVF